MGKGDKRTRRGKIWKKSYGKTRPHKDARTKAAGVVRTTATAARPKAKTSSSSPAPRASRPKPAAPPRVPGPLGGPSAEPPRENAPAAESGS